MEGALTGYAARVLVHLTNLPPKTFTGPVEIGRATNLPGRELVRVLQLLLQAGYVERRGGNPPSYSMEFCPWSISLLDLYRVTGENPFGSRSATTETWGELGFQVEGGLRSYLAETSIGALAAIQTGSRLSLAPEMWLG
jgi:DNA-binding IscR family transcriptional regulator